jgi:hypothetical protein
MNFTPVRRLVRFFAVALPLYSGLPVPQPSFLDSVVLSDAQIQKLVLLNGAKGHDGTFFASVSQALGLTSVQYAKLSSCVTRPTFGTPFN